MTLADALEKLASDMDRAMAGNPEFIGPSGLRFHAPERLRAIMAHHGLKPDTDTNEARSTW